MAHVYPFNLAVVAYLCATGLALAHLVQRHELLHRLAGVLALGGWVCHTAALVLTTALSSRPPLGSLAEAVSVLAWAIVALEMWAERRPGMETLGAFVLPVAVLLMVKAAAARPAGLPGLGSALQGAWLWVHVGLALVGVAAFALSFGAAIMYVVQEHQLKAKRQGTFYYRLPDLETLDRLAHRALAVGFPFLTIGLLLGALWAGTAWGSVFTFDPLSFLSLCAWGIYAATLAGRTAAGWGGRRAAWCAIAGFLTLVLTLGAGLFLPGRHGP